jgi:hypothetical protein
MAGHSEKKQNKKKDVKNKISKVAIIVVTLSYIFINAYSVLFNGYSFSKTDTLGFLFLTTVNFALFRLMDVFASSQFYMPLVDLLIINLSVQILINFHWKFWFLYLVVPGYFLMKGGAMVYEHVKTVGKAGEGEVEQDQRTPKSNSQKRKIIK